MPSTANALDLRLWQNGLRVQMPAPGPTAAAVHEGLEPIGLDPR